MQTQAFWLLTNEGYLAHGCMTKALRDLKSTDCSHWRAFYAAFFLFTIGLERMLKLALLVEHYHEHERRFPSRKVLKDEWGHNLSLLYRRFGIAQTKYAVKLPAGVAHDALDDELLQFLSEFALGSRYYNLDALGTAWSRNPLLEFRSLVIRIYKSDVLEIKRLRGEEEVSAIIEQMEPFVYSMPQVAPDGTAEDFGDRMQDAAMIQSALPSLIWRLVKRLLPIKEFFWHFHPAYPPMKDTQLDQQDIPALSDFLDFASSDRANIDDPEWPED